MFIAGDLFVVEYDVAYMLLSWLLSCILSALSDTLSNCNSWGSDANICVVCGCNLPSHNFYNTALDIELSPSNARIFLSNCEGFV